MRTKSRIFNTGLRVVPPLLLTLAYASVAKAALPAPEIVIADPCSLPPNRTFSFSPDTNPLLAWEPYIKSNPAATWSALGTGGAPCTGSGTSWTCAGLSVTLPPATPLQAQTPFFTDAPGAGGATATSQMLHVTANNGQAGEGAKECSADFTFKAILGGGGWGPDPARVPLLPAGSAGVLTLLLATSTFMIVSRRRRRGDLGG